MKKKFNLVGNTFTHLTNGNKGYSVHGKESKYIEWVTEGAEDTFYIDNTINDGIQDGRDVEDTYEIIFTHDQQLLALGDKYQWCPAQGFWIKEPKIYEKSKMISMIASNKAMCEGHKLRLEWVERIGDQVDLYGRGFNEIADKEEGLCDYMFSIAIENGQYETYFTEKLLDCFATGTIPIYLGAPDIGEHFNKDGIIELTDEFDVSEEIYYSKMDAMKDNLERAKEMEVLEDFIYLRYFK